MTKLLLIVCALFACGAAVAQTQIAPGQPQAAPPQAPTGSEQSTPPARLIRQHPAHPDPHPVERAHHPVDDRCKPLKDQLEAALTKPGNQHRLFQAKLAHNAGTRFCREGHPDKGMAEFQRGLSYLQDTTSPTGH
jgi:hypothetical protein